MHEPAATIAGFTLGPTAAWIPALSTAITHLRDALGEQTYESLARKGETFTAAVATFESPRPATGFRICQVVASQKFVSEEAVAYCDTTLTDIRLEKNAPERTSEPLPGTPNEVSGPLPTSAVRIA